MRAAAYYRVSTERQAGEDRHSLDAQRAAFVRRCAERQYEAIGEYQDVESGRKVGREAYQRLLEAARAHELDVIVVTFLDRFGRDQWEVMRSLAELRALGVTVDAIYEETTEFVMVALSAWKSQQESERIGARVRSGMEQAAREGIWQGGQRPYGYRVEAGRLVVDEVEAETVRYIFRRYVDGNAGHIQIARELNARGVTTAAGGTWYPSRVHAVLHRTAYRGENAWNGIASPAPAIVDAELWDAATQRAEAKRRLPAGRTQSSAHLLSGLLECGECGGRMKGDGRGWYICRTHNLFGTCERNAHRAHAVDDALIARLQEVAGDVEASATRYRSAAGDIRTALNATERRLSDLPARFRRNVEMFERGVFATEAQYAEANHAIEDDRVRLNADLARLNDELARTEASAATARALAGISDVFNASDPAVRKARVQAIVERVVLPVDGELRVYLRS